jgi:UDP-N-acetylglucosamine diphosphorylase/glucosamine-1-phosphate N-acetyltransferase
MRSIILFDDPELRLQLLPFTYTRPIAGIRCGIRTIAEKWNDWLTSQVSYQTEAYLSPRFSAIHSEDQIYINGAVCPDVLLVKAIENLGSESVLFSTENKILAARTSAHDWTPAKVSAHFKNTIHSEPIVVIRNIWDIFSNNGAQIKLDFERIKGSRQSQKLTDPFTHCYNPENIFIEDGAVIKASVLNAENGPIYIGRNALIQEGSLIQGPFAMGDNSVLAQGTKIRPNTTVGPFCKLGGEVSNSILFGYSNKGHDGYLGNSVLGEWCNLGANTNNSNLKNDHTPVKLHSYVTEQLESTGLLFCGLFMGDYSKAGISTMFNTGTLVGVNVNVFGAGFQSKHIPSYSWGGNAEGFTEYRFEKAMAVAQDTVSRRGVTFDETDKKILREVFEQTQDQRKLS